MAKDNKQLFDAPAESTGPVECLGMTFESDEARRAYFTEKLREKLQDPEFRKIEGFPVGDDDDILAMSDPPYYTACPNPFVADVLVVRQKTQAADKEYHREPFASDVTEGKNDPLYNAHSYHTKVPHKAIMRYILHYTDPGDVVFDGFCGTAMTAVASQACARKDVTIANELPDAKWGARYCIAVDLSPEATFIGHSLNTPFNESEFESAVKRVTAEVERRTAHLYETSVRSGGKSRTAEIAYTIWSEVAFCPECGEIFTFSDVAVAEDWKKEHSPFPCPGCGVHLKGRQLRRFLENRWDPFLRNNIEVSKHLPVLVNCELEGQRVKKAPDEEDRKKAFLQDIAIEEVGPITELLRLDRYYKDSLHLRQLTHVHQLYTERTWYTLTEYWNAIDRLDVSARTKQQLVALFTSTLPRLDRLNRYMPNHNRHVGPLVGTLYISWLTVEISPIRYWRDKSSTFLSLRSMPGTAFIGTGSSTDLRWVESSSIDYIFTDPPFGHNLQYAELNQRPEAWLRVVNCRTPEAVISDSQKKDIHVYESLMTACFKEFHRILKPGRWMTVEFHNSRNAVWNAIQEALSVAGFVVADVRTLDKKKGTTNQLFYSGGAVKQDLVITAYKPTEILEAAFLREAGTEQGAWDFVENHLAQLPIFVPRGQRCEIITERNDYLLYDRMVAFHVQRGVSVPLSAAEFYVGLRQRFSERDGMFFLPEHAAEYDKKRADVDEVVQLELFVSDELTAIKWLKRQLDRKPQPFSEIQPQFMREVSGWGKHEKSLELSELLEQNFICYEGDGEVPSQIHSYLSSNFHELRNLEKDDPKLIAKAKNRWYVPDPRKEADLEKIRHRALMKEFNEYVESKGKLKVVRTEALRAGFKECWQNGDYKTIVGMAKRVKDDIIQEDPALLMYYDNALMRAEG